MENRIMRKLALALSTAALVVSSVAVAQTASPAAPAKARAPMADMTRAEAQARAEARFARRDANRDGAIDRADRQARRGQMFERLDTDRNGSISRAEFDARTAHRTDRRAKRMERRGGERAAMRSPLTREAFVDRALAMFDRADANRDGTVTVAERKAARETLRGQWRARAAERQG